MRIWEADGIIWFYPWPLAFIVFIFALAIVGGLIGLAVMWVKDRT
jgi:hypothetical protein